MTTSLPTDRPMTADALYAAHRDKVNRGTDRLFGWLIAFQYVAGLSAALWLSPLTYDGTAESIHPHVWAALVVGSLVSIPPVMLAVLMPGRVVTRYVISVCQALSSALLIHISGGRIETHFHVFGSLAFLAFYRDWKILLPATLVTAADHFVRGIYFPQSVFGVVAEGHWRWLEHAGWVVYEDIFLIGSCVSMTREMRNTAARTAEAFRKNCVLEAIRDTALDCVIGMDRGGRITDFNAAAERTFGYAREDAVGRPFVDLIASPQSRETLGQSLSQSAHGQDGPVLNKRVEMPALRADGSEFAAEVAITAVRVDGPTIFMAYLRDITDRKGFERQAGHAEMLALVASRTDNAVIITDPAGRIEWANEGFTRVTGYSVAEVAGKKPGSFLQGPDTNPETVRDIRRHLDRGEGFTAEIVNYAKSGRKYWLSIEVQPVRNADGTLRHFMAIESDITAHKLMEAELRASREQYELAVRGSSDGIWDWDLVTGRVYFSPALHEQIGYAIGDLDPDPEAFIALIHPDDRDRVRQAIGDAHARRTAIYRAEFRVKHKDGHYVWILSRGAALHDAAGRAIRMSGSHTDITEQRHAAEAVRQAEEKYRGLFENSVLGIFQSTRDGHYLSANPAMARIYGYDSPAHLVDGVIDIGQQHYIDPARRSELVATLDRDGAVVGFEAEIRRTDGRHRWISKRARAVRDDAGNTLYYEGTVEDITDAKAAQAALRQAKEEAEQAREAAEAASVAKSQFLANMSHEIRTPLNGVIGIAGLLIRKGGLTEQQLRYANVIRSSGDSLLSLINDILDFSKIEAGKLELCPTEFDPRSAIEDVVEMLVPKADAKRLTLACHVSRAVPARLVGDPDRVRQNLINLVNNAIKFTEAGQVMIRATVQSEADAHAVLKFTVQDTGVGIPKDRLDRLFKSFSQVDASTTRKYGGTGLGLAIVKQLAALMGGEVGVESTPGAGSSFWFTAKLAVAGPAAGEPAHKSDLVAVMRGLRVLVVDDQPAYLDVFREQLTHWSLDVDTCESTDDARRKLESAVRDGSPYRVALIDLDTPQGDCAAFVREAKHATEFAATTFLLMSAMDSGVGGDLAGELGLTPCLNKPIRHSTLFDALANVLVCRLSAAPAGSTVAAGRIGKLTAHVLLAEDNEVNQEVARGILADAGCTVEVVGNGEAALRACLDPAKRFDVVLMDCQMPIMDGFEATRRIRAARHDALPIVALTANAIAGDRELCLAAGMSDYVTKPIDPDVLLETIKRLVTAGARPAAAPAAVPPAPASAGDETPLASTAVPIDAASLLRRCRGKADLAERLLKMFADSVDNQIAGLKSALAESDWPTFTRLAHTIKGTGANLSADAVSAVASELERLGKAADASSAGVVLGRLEAEVKACVATIPTIFSGPSELLRSAA